MSQFDPNQSAVQYGESLLASQEERRKKSRKRQKKIKKLNYALGALQIGDIFLTRNAQKKAETFEQNLLADKAREINDFNLARSFRTNELDKLQQRNPGLDFTNKKSWDVTYDAKGKIIKAGSVFNALKTEYAENLRSDYGAGSMAGIEKEDLKRYREEVLDMTKQAFSALQAKYTKHEPLLGVSEDLIKSQYKQLINEGVKQILHPRNTSSVRKLLAKVGIANDIEESLQNVEMGGVNVYLNKKLIEKQTARKTKKDNALAEYNKLIKERGDTQLEVNRESLRKGSSSRSAQARSLYSDIYTGHSDLYSFQVTGKPGKAHYMKFGSSDQNPRIKRLDSIPFKHKDNDNEEAALLSAIPTTTGKKARYSEIHDTLVAEKRFDDLKEIQMAIDLNINDLIKTKMAARNITDPSLVALSDAEIAIARYNAVIDLVEVGAVKTGIKNRIFDIKVTSYEDFINSQAEVDPNIAEQREELIAESKLNRPKLIETQDDEGKIIQLLELNGQQVTVKEQFEVFEKELRNNIDTKDGVNKEEILQSALNNEFPSELHGEVSRLYYTIINEDEEGWTPPGSTRYPWELETSTEVKKKVTEVSPVVTERTDNIRTLLTGHLKRFDIDNEEQAISNLLDVFTPAVLEIESSGDYQAKNKISTARGGFQFLQGSVEPALNRVEKYLGEQPWGAQLRIHKDASLLTPKQQTLLFIGDMLEKKGSDKLMQLVFNGDMEGMIKAYEVLHHTNADPKTKARARKIFKTYFN